MRLLRRLLLGAMLIAALAPPAGAAGAPQRQLRISPSTSWSGVLPEDTDATSVAIAPDGSPWFGTSFSFRKPDQWPLLAYRSGPQLLTVPLPATAKGGSTDSLQFGPDGSLWFVREEKTGTAIARRAADGTLTEFPLPGKSTAHALAIGPEGDLWLIGGTFTSPAIGRLDSDGSFTWFPLAPESLPSSLVEGPEGNLWFTEERAGRIGRITPSGRMRLFRLDRGVHPDQLVVGADGALWFAESVRPGGSREPSNRLGRITTSDRVNQYPVPLPDWIGALVADPRGLFWFTSGDKGIYAMWASGRMVDRGCLGYCGVAVQNLAVGHHGALWFSAPVPLCSGCGGGGDLLIENEGSRLGEIRTAIVPATRAAARPQSIEGASITSLPERTYGNSVAIGPDGTPWFGVSVGGPTVLGHVQSEELSVETLRQRGPAITSSLQFDPQGNLWFVVETDRKTAIARRAQNGRVTEFPLPPGSLVTALTVGPEGGIWFTRGTHGTGAVVGRIGADGLVTQTRLGRGSEPFSIVAGPDGALWFTERHAGKVGRITTAGEIRLFALRRNVRPQQIVAGPDGALWFGEDTSRGPQSAAAAHIGRITTDGQASELPIPFGRGTERLAADPRGLIWFSTDDGQLSSISTAGIVGARGCLVYCRSKAQGIALAPDGTLWFAADQEPCDGCGGGSALIHEAEGTPVGEIPPGALDPKSPSPGTALAADETARRKRPPTVETLPPYGLNRFEAVLNSRISPHGHIAVYRFQYGKTKRYGHTTPVPEESLYPYYQDQEFETAIEGLTANTIYHCRVFAALGGKRIYGNDLAFRTPR
jgi:streptogramin lyase